MSSENILESFIRLITKLDYVAANLEPCKELKRKYKPIRASDNKSKKDSVMNPIIEEVKRLYAIHREEVMSKDFSFIESAKKDESGKYIITENTLILDNVDFGSLYLNTADSDDDENLKYVNNEILFLFYQVAPEDDQKVIDTKYRKKHVDPEPTTPNQMAEKLKKQPNLAKKMEEILNKNKDKLKHAEKNPSAIPEVLADFFKNNSGDMAGMLTGMLGNMGFDPSKMK